MKARVEIKKWICVVEQPTFKYFVPIISPPIVKYLFVLDGIKAQHWNGLFQVITLMTKAVKQKNMLTLKKKRLKQLRKCLNL